MSTTAVKTTTIAKLQSGVVLKAEEGEFAVVAETVADENGDHFYAVGKVVLENDFRPFHTWAEAYAEAERLLA